MDTVAAADRLDEAQAVNASPVSGTGLWMYGLVGALAVLAMGTWLVWFSAYVQRKFAEEDVRAACHRIMPETAERCFDTVVIQRGGVRR
jgi:hypothetical protein